MPAASSWSSSSQKPNHRHRLAVRARLSRSAYLAGETVHGLVVVTSYADQPAERVSVRVHGHARVDRRWLPDISLNAHTTRPLPTSSSSSSYSHHDASSSAAVASFAEQQEGGGGGGGGSLLSRIVGLSILGGGGADNGEGGGGSGNGNGSGGYEGLLPAYPDLLQENLACVFTTPPYVLTRPRTPLAPGQQLTYAFRLRLPARLIPSYNRGTGARFFYMATVSVGGGKRYAHIPFTVLASGFMDGAPMPPPSHVGMGFLEAEELHSRLVTPEDRRDIYGEGAEPGQEEGEERDQWGGGGGFCWRRFAAKYLRNGPAEEVIPPSYHDDDGGYDSDQDGGEEEEEERRLRDDVYLAGLSFGRKTRPPPFGGPGFSGDGTGGGGNGGGAMTTMYAIRNGSARLGTFVAYGGRAGGYQPGEAIDGAFDFGGDGVLRCYEVFACLVREEWSYSPHRDRRRLISRAVEDTFHALTASSLSCSVCLTLPGDAPPSFETPFTALEWKICFDFVTGKDPDPLTLARREREAARQLRRRGLRGVAGDGDGSYGEEEEEERYEEASGIPETATPATTARLRWVLPLRVIPPLDSDPTDLLLDHNLRRCATELLV